MYTTVGLKYIYICYINNNLVVNDSDAQCSIPKKLRGQWFSWENGQNTLTELDATSMSRMGTCIDITDDYVNYTMLFKRQDKCYTCVKLVVRTVNVLDKIECK